MTTGGIEVQAKDIKILNKSSENLSFRPFSKASATVSITFLLLIIILNNYFFMVVN